MNPPGEPNPDDQRTAARAALLDVLEALQPHLASLILIGAQAIYLHTGTARVALAEMTKDNDLGLDPRTLPDSPRLEALMRNAGFDRDPDHPQPGSWVNGEGTLVDLMVPAALAGTGGQRAARIPPHSKHAARRAVGIEAAIVDHTPTRIDALDPYDERAFTVNIASPAALLIAKLHKISDRVDAPDRLINKDAHDLYRLLLAIPTAALAAAIHQLQDDPLTGKVTRQAVTQLSELFAAGPDASSLSSPPPSSLSPPSPPSPPPSSSLSPHPSRIR